MLHLRNLVTVTKPQRTQLVSQSTFSLGSAYGVVRISLGHRAAANVVFDVLGPYVLFIGLHLKLESRRDLEGEPEIGCVSSALAVCRG